MTTWTNIGLCLLAGTFIESAAIGKDAVIDKNVKIKKTAASSSPKNDDQDQNPDIKTSRKATREVMRQETSDNSGFNSPFAQQPSPFAGILDQSTLNNADPTRILRANQPFFGASYSIANGTARRKKNGITTKTNSELDILNATAIFPLPIGLRIGVIHMNGNAKYKFDDITAKSSGNVKGLLASAAFHNGFGVGVGLYDVDESVSVLSYDKDEHYGYLKPSIYFATDDTEIALSYMQSMRHETGTVDGKVHLNIEQSFGDVYGVLNVTHNRRAENDDDERNTNDVAFGARFMTSSKSFVLALLTLEESYNRSPESASASSVARQKLDLSSDWFIAPEHVIGGHIAYAIGSGKGGKDSTNNKIKHDTNSYGLAASYSYRM